MSVLLIFESCSQKLENGVKTTVQNDRSIIKFDDDNHYDYKSEEIGYYSVDCESIYRPDLSSACYLFANHTDGGVHFDLSSGYESFIKKVMPPVEQLDNLLTCLVQNNLLGCNENNEHRIYKGDFVCLRGLMTKLLCTPYEKSEDWLFAVKKFNGVCYMVSIDIETSTSVTFGDTEKGRLMCYWGFKFEQYLTTTEENKGSYPNVLEPVNTHKYFMSVNMAKLGDHTLFFGGEVDCQRNINGKKEYIELKTNVKLDSNNRIYTFKRYKLLKWWAQSYLIGIKSIIAGFRDDDGIVDYIKEFSTTDIPSQSIEWSPRVCFHFLDEMLRFVKQSVTDENSIYQFEYSSTEKVIRCTKLIKDNTTNTFTTTTATNSNCNDSNSGSSSSGSSVVGDGANFINGYQILPTWYTELVSDQN